MSLTVRERVCEFVKLGRPHFLVGGVLMYGLGSALAVVAGATTDWGRYAWGQALVTSTQWMTHYANDFFDLEADRANTTPTLWSGGSRVLTRGSIAPHAALVAAIVLAAGALSAAFVLGTSRYQRPGVLPLGLLMVALSWAYSAPPIRLLGRGLGEFTTALVVTLLTPLLGFYLQSGSLRPLLFLGCAPLCGLQFAMLLTIELPDAESDQANGKRTLVVRRGPSWAARYVVIAVVASFCALPIFGLFGLPWPIALLALAPTPFAAQHISRLSRGAFRDPRRWESLARTSVALLVSTTSAELLGALFLIGMGQH